MKEHNMNGAGVTFKVIPALEPPKVKSYTVYLQKVIDWYPRIKYSKKKIKVVAADIPAMYKEIGKRYSDYDVRMFWPNY